MSYQSGWPKGIMVDQLQMSIHQDDSQEIKLDSNNTFDFNDDDDHDQHRMVMLSNQSFEDMNQIVDGQDNRDDIGNENTDSKRDNT